MRSLYKVLEEEALQINSSNKFLIILLLSSPFGWGGEDFLK